MNRVTCTKNDSGKNRLIRSFSQGFTLIELLVVIAIIAILTAIILPNFATAKAKSRDGKRVSDISEIKLALELYAENCGGVYPPSLTTPSTCNGQTISVASYISGSKLPTDPLTNLQYAYAPLSVNGVSSTVCNGYHLGAATELGGASLTGDIAESAQGTVCTASGATVTYGTGSNGVNVTGSADFFGTSAQCTASSLSSGQAKYNYCYDVTN